MATFRSARDDEDEVLGRGHQLGAERFRTVTRNTGDTIYIRVSVTRICDTYVRFDRALFPLIRKIGGKTEVALAPGTDTPVAVCCFLPPKLRPGAYFLFMSGWLSVLLAQSVTTTYRFQRGYLKGEKMWQRLGEPVDDGTYVLILGTDPRHAGHGYAGKLLQHVLEQHEKAHPGVPVYLETATDHAQRVYERLGFQEMWREQEKQQKMDQSPLNKLPAELRNRIYELVLPRPGPCQIRKTIYRKSIYGEQEAEQPAMTRTCRQIRHESLTMFYASRDFCVNIIEPQDSTCYYTNLVERDFQQKISIFKTWLECTRTHHSAIQLLSLRIEMNERAFRQVQKGYRSATNELGHLLLQYGFQHPRLRITIITDAEDSSPQERRAHRQELLQHDYKSLLEVHEKAVIFVSRGYHQ
ncbi:uncharacterized protein CLAFUR5_06851 [Fulvia fulva]|uniref:N-acetyltransferase domain-containing protein n=1 Tax=Passalora fulva TaxID=5499 RepID=A0A9Q8LIU7_PASFU|nr:uncharacterized protein CLAFUR5_06851 [Fulvia fulva]KAK4623073.1 hypothetical protein CLAFUR0_06711 [Fulvia fulva]UJO18441.1 hypothetical protein CLAFUR5_06851 [Fulvia fulva]